MMFQFHKSVMVEDSEDYSESSFLMPWISLCGDPLMRMLYATLCFKSCKKVINPSEQFAFLTLMARLSLIRI